MSSTRRLPPIWLLVSAAWFVPAILAAFRDYLQAAIDGRDGPTIRAMLWEGGDWALLALITPAVFWFARRHPLERGTLARRVPLHLLGAIVLCAAWATGGTLLSLVLHGNSPYGSSPLSWLLTTLPFGVAVYFALLGVEHAAFYFVQSREREQQLALARLGALRMQLQPHFLFNSLNAITVIVRDQDTATATRILEQLGDMLRRVIRADRPLEVTVGEEVEFVRQYLEIETVRFSDRLQPAFDIDPTVVQAGVPDFLLQPLVENAVRHAVARRSTPTRVTLRARREGPDLVLTVRDDGPGVPVALTEGVGLGNTRARLASLYGTRARLALEPTLGGGATATVRLPYHELESPRG